jgi:AcrR family transcriptional regulator
LDSVSQPEGAFTKELPAIAARVRDAAKRILARDGFSGVTINSVAEEAGEYRTAVAYYFGGKRGLLEAVADSITPYEACVEAVAQCDALPPGPERVAAHVSALRAMAEDQESFRAFFELFPHLLREEGLRRHFADLNEWYRALDVRMLGITPRDPEELRYVASILVAAVDGLAFQACLDPDRVDLKKAFAVLERAVTALLPTLAAADSVEPVDSGVRAEAATSRPGAASSRRPWHSQDGQG